MPKQDTATTVMDVVYDTVAALDMYTGMFGSEGTTVVSVEADHEGASTRKLLVTLSDDSVYCLTVSEVQ